MLRPCIRILAAPFLQVHRQVSSKFQKFPAYKTLQEDEIERIKKSWTIVRECDNRFIEILQTEMLTDIKMYELYFNPHKTPEVCVTELPEFKNHPRGVFNSIDYIVGELENENVILCKMKEIGERHRRIGISKKHINLMTSTIYRAVECTVGPCMFDRLIDLSWEKFLTNFNEVVGVTASRYCT